jgi:hypothetical protein
LKIELKKRTRYVVLNDNTKLYQYQITRSVIDIEDGDKIIGEVTQKPNDPSVWGIRNLSDGIWQTIRQNGGIIELPPGRAVTLSENLQINFYEGSAKVVLY